MGGGGLLFLHLTLGCLDETLPPGSGFWMTRSGPPPGGAFSLPGQPAYPRQRGLTQPPEPQALPRLCDTTPGCRPPGGGAQNAHTKETRSSVGKRGQLGFRAKPGAAAHTTRKAGRDVSPPRTGPPRSLCPPAGSRSQVPHNSCLPPPLPTGTHQGCRSPRGQPPRGTEVQRGPDARTQCRTPGAQRASPSPRLSLPFQFSGCFLSWAVTARTQQGSPEGRPPLWSSGGGWAHPRASAVTVQGVPGPPSGPPEPRRIQYNPERRPRLRG